MLNVLFVTDTLRQRFGVTSVMMTYFRNIDAAKVHIDFMAFDDSEKEIVDEIKGRGSEVVFFPRLSLGNISAFRSFFARFFQQNTRYDIVHSHFCQIDALIFPIAKKYGVKKCISHSHNTKYSNSKIRSVRNWVMCLPMPRMADVWAACSKDAGRFLYGKRFTSSPKALVINNAINCDAFSYDETMRQKLRRDMGLCDKLVYGFVGSLKPEKNTAYLLERFAEFIAAEAVPERYVLMIVGAGALEAELKQRAEALGISAQVRFMGRRADVAQLMQAMDVFLLPSLFEGLPVVLIEAQVAGLPCIASANNPREAAISEHIRFIPLDDTQSWVRAMKDAASYTRKDGSPDAVKSGYEIKSAARRLESFYESIILGD